MRLKDRVGIWMPVDEVRVHVLMAIVEVGESAQALILAHRAG